MTKEEEYYTKPLWHLISSRNESMIVCDKRSNIDKRKHLDWTSCSPGYETEEELRKEQGIPDEPCKICGNVFGTNYQESTKIKLLSQNICFTCELWQEKVSIKHLETIARIEGKHYTIAPDDPKAYFKGFGGAEFKIRFFDGREVVTHNLWFQGNIPEIFKADLPDNAVFFE